MTSDREFYTILQKQAKAAKERNEEGSTPWNYWNARYERYTAELAKLGGDSDTGIEKPRGQR